MNVYKRAVKMLAWQRTEKKRGARVLVWEGRQRWATSRTQSTESDPKEAL